MNSKRELFEGFHKRMDDAIEAKYYLEASWYAYAIIEDRLHSLLVNSGGGHSDPKAPLGAKLAMLKERAQSNRLLHENLPYQNIFDWKQERNDLMHAMASGQYSQPDLNKRSYLLATNGKSLVKEVSSAAARQKEHGHKVTR